MKLQWGFLVELNLNLEGGLFLNDKKLQFIDYQHFNGNQTFIYSPGKALSSF